jgi:FkbM family methyltransferase
MKLHTPTGLYFPAGETHFTGTHKRTGRPVAEGYQADRVAEALKYVADRDVAVDVGAHVGLLTRELAKHFRRVVAFEPGLETYECLKANTKGLGNVVLANVALGSATGEIGIESVGANSGDRQLVPGGKGVRLMRLDDYPLDGCDLIKMDVQGYEAPVLEGSRLTCMAFDPVLIVEEEPADKLRVRFTKEGAVRKILGGWEAECRATVGADRIYAPGFNGYCPYVKYAERGDYHWQQRKMDACAAEVAKIVNAGNHDLVLDVGCGDGAFTAKLDRAVGIDNNKTAVELAVAHGVDARHLSAYRAHKLGQFGAVCMFDVFEHLPKQELLLDRLHRVTKNLYVLNPVPNGSRWHVREFTDAGLVATASVHGWRVAAQHPLRSPAGPGRP